MAGCPDVGVDTNEGKANDPPIVEFDPSHAIVPFPNNLILGANGKVTVPAQTCESLTSKAVRDGVLAKLDGFGTYEAAMTVTMTGLPDFESIKDHVVMYTKTAPPRAVPIFIVPTLSARFHSASASDCSNPNLVATLAIVPMVPLAQNTTYDVAVLDGLTTNGKAFAPSFTWTLVRSKTDPVTISGTDADGNPNVTVNNTPLDPTNFDQLKQIVGIDHLWRAHDSALNSLASAGNPRDSVLVAWELTTATVTSPIDPMVTNSLAATLSTAAFAGIQFPPGSGITTPGQGPAFLAAVVPGGAATCAAIGCANVGDVLGAAFSSQQFQEPAANPLTGGAATPGAWNDPVHPTVPVNPLPGLLGTLIITPAGPMPANGWPTVIFGHGLGSSKESLAVFGPQLAGQGFASVAIDFVDHGSRAVRTRSDAECAGSPDPTVLQECFALFLSTDLAATRDNFRQTLLDLQRLHKVLVKCSEGTGCAGPAGIQFKVDQTHIVYAGISLGGIIGSTFVSLTPNIKAAVLNVPGVGLLDILENTANIGIRCTLVNALIDAEIVHGAKWAGGNTGLCLTDAWKNQLGYKTFSAIARWVVDPADGANYVATRLPTRKILIQEVVDDQVVPNIATDREAALVGFTAPLAADPGVGTAVPSTAITTMITSSKWVRYTTLPAGGGFPGNAFQHASLLAPVSDGSGPTLAGKLGTLRVQTDAITFLVANQ